MSLGGVSIRWWLDERECYVEAFDSLGLLVLASFCFADDVKVGDVVNEYREEIFSTTDRITAGDVV